MTAKISGTGTLRIETTVPCQIAVDGDHVATLGPDETAKVDLLPGTYRVEAASDEGVFWNRDIEIQAGLETETKISDRSEEQPSAQASATERMVITPRKRTSARPPFLWLVFALLATGTVVIGALYLKPEWRDSAAEWAAALERRVGLAGEVVTTAEDTPVTIPLAGGSSQMNGFSLLVAPNHGALALSTDSTRATYSPTADFSGDDRFVYTFERESNPDTIEVTIRVEAVVDAPVANNDTATTPFERPASVDVLSNDRDPDGGRLRITNVTPPEGGRVSIHEDSSRVTFTPDAGYSGLSQFSYVVANQSGMVDTAQVSLRVRARPPTPADVDISWSRVRAGTYQMGSSRGTSDAQPSHLVNITSPFRVSRHEVTVGQFRKFVAATGYQTDAERLGGAWQAGTDSLVPGLTWRNPGFGQASDHPVVCVSWNDAQAFAEWMGGRLPTEAEWEYVARAGTVANKLPGDWEETTWYAKNTDGGTKPVGQKSPNAWGVYDVQGNVWEWVLDWYSPDYYEESPADNPQGPSTGKLRVCRGGSWYNETCWLPLRNRASPTYRANNIGFRMVKPVSNNPPS